MKLFYLIAQFFVYFSVIKCSMPTSVGQSEPIDKLISSSSKRLTLVRFQDEDDDGIHGTADRDYPVLTDIPRTSFSCANRVPGYYADMETRCQVFHMCMSAQKTSFLCHNGTIFNQKLFTCDWWYTSNCNESPQWFFLNENLYKKNIKTDAVKAANDKSKPIKTKTVSKAKAVKKTAKQQKSKSQ